jgi:outer membrane receptor protein involved in Fe transport
MTFARTIRVMLSGGTLFLFLGGDRIALSQVVVSGRSLDENRSPVVSVLITLESELPSSPRQSRSNADGEFTFNLSQAGRYLVSTSSPGFHDLNRRPVDLVVGINVLTIDLVAIQNLIYSLDVYPEKTLEVEQIASTYDLTDEDLNSIPVARSYYLQNSMAALPGVIQDSQGKLHFNGSSAEQTNFLLDGFNVADPVTGQLDATLSVEAVKSLDLFSGRYSVEFGKGTGGSMAINTPMGSNRFRPAVTNFIPGIDQERGWRLSSWRPRLSLSGPIKRDRVWFFDGLDLQYRQNVIPELPKGQDRTVSWNLSNLFRVQANLSSSNILSGAFLYNYLNAPKSGLSPLDPVETTLDRRARRYFYNAKDQIYLPSKTLIEVGFASYQSFGREIPQGQEIYQITPAGHRGNYFIDATLKGRRHEALLNIFLPPLNRWGSHQLKTGLNFDYSSFSQDTTRTGFEFYDLNDLRLSRVSFSGNGQFHQANLESSLYLQDRWSVRSWLLAEAGIRLDRDRILSDTSITPRFSFSMLPPRFKNVKFSAGFGLIPSSTNLRLFTRNLDQYSITERFGPNGIDLTGIPYATVYRINPPDLSIPKTKNWSAGLEFSLPGKIESQLNYLRKRGHSGYDFSPESSLTSIPAGLALPPGAPLIIYNLQNSKIERYDAVEVSLTKRFRRDSEAFLSYTRSRASSNAALEVNIDEPLTNTDRAGPMPWDTPNRLISWFFFPLTRNNWIESYVEWRDGFPFSVYDALGQQVGHANGNRLPRFFTLNIHYERRFLFRGRDWALRIGADNLTDNDNYSLANNNTESPDFLRFYGSQPRKFVVRIRWLGKSQT